MNNETLTFQGMMSTERNAIKEKQTTHEILEQGRLVINEDARARVKILV